MVVLDATIVTVALAHIKTALGFSDSGLEWVVNAYVLRVGANLMMLGVGTAIGGVFFFLTLFVQEVWGYSPLRAGLSFLPFTAVMLVATAAATRLVPRVGPRPLLIAGAALSAGGVAEADSGAAASLLNTGRQVGASIGLAVLGTVAWTVYARAQPQDLALSTPLACPLAGPFGHPDNSAGDITCEISFVL
jgi:Na+/melibiose symporter-like transporter